MKIKKIASFCNSAQTIIVFDKFTRDGDLDVQWVGDGYACYPIYDMPKLDMESLCVIFDVPEKKRATFVYRHDPVPDTYSFSDIDETENLIVTSHINIVANGRVLMPLPTQRGIAFIDTKYLAPLADIRPYEIYERIAKDKTSYFAVKAGLILQAIILPYEIITDDFAQRFEDIARGCRFYLSIIHQNEHAVPDIQMAMDRIPESGPCEENILGGKIHG